MFYLNSKVVYANMTSISMNSYLDSKISDKMSVLKSTNVVGQGLKKWKGYFLHFINWGR